ELVVAEDFLDAGLLDVEDFAAQGQDGLEVALPAVVGGAAGALPFDEEELGFISIAGSAIQSLPGRPPPESMLLRSFIAFLALVAASRAWAAMMTLFMIFLASFGFSSRYFIRYS